MGGEPQLHVDREACLATGDSAAVSTAVGCVAHQGILVDTENGGGAAY